MKQFVRYAFRPVENRHYTGSKIALWQLAIRYSFVLILCIIGMIFSNTKGFALIFLVIIACMLFDYFVFDAISDKIAWKVYGKRFYGKDLEPMSPEQQAMKQFEDSKGTETYEQLQENLRRK
jgi:hypothetical protein